MSELPAVMTATNTRIVVDTSSNVPDDLLSQHQMIEVPTLVIFGDQSFQNKHELSEAASVSYTHLTLPTSDLV